MVRSRRAVALIALAASISSLLAVAPPAHAGHQYLWWNDDGSSFRTFGANATVSIYQGQIEYYNDSFYPTADIYVVASGSVSPGSTLTDVVGTPNTVFGASGGLFIDETIAFTKPSGNTPPGRYAVVYDEGQNGKFDGPDKLFDPAFEVVIPINVPPLPNSGIAAAKSAAGSERLQWQALITIVQGIEALIKLKEVYDCFKLYGFIGCGVAQGIGYLSDEIKNAALGLVGLQDAKEAAKDVVLDLVAHYRGIEKDPPDAQFRQPDLLLPQVNLDPGTADPLERAQVQIGSTASTDASLADSLLHALERYQGADAESNGDWALHHARTIQTRAQQLSARYATTNATLSSYRSALTGDTREFVTDLDRFAAAAAANRTRMVEQGFAPDELAALRNLGLTDAKIAGLRTFIGTQGDPSGLTRAQALDAIDDLIATNDDAAADMQTLANAMTSNISDLVAAGVSDPQLSVNAGGPYTGNENATVTLSGSATGDTIASYAWDLDNDGQFDDATGASPSVTFPRAMESLIGLRATGTSGRTGTGYARVRVNDTNGPPAVTATPAARTLEVGVGGSQAFSASASDPNGDALTYRWLVDRVQAGTGPSFTYAAPTTPGMRIVRLEVSDTGSGGTIATEWQVQVLFPDADGDGWRANLDCNDANAAVNPGRSEIALNGIDDDCNAATSDNGSPPVALFNPSGGRNVALLEGGASVVSVSSQAAGCATAQAMLNLAPDDCPWTTATGQTTGTVKIDLGATYLIDRVDLMPSPPGYAGVTERVRTFEIATSSTTTDDAAFTTRLAATAADDATLQTFGLPAPVLARYVRYRATGNRGSTCCVTTGQLKVRTGQQGGSATVTFTNRSSDVNGDLTSYAWSFGDGGTSTAASPVHTFPGPGTYTVSLTATDSVGQTNTFSLAQRVLSPPSAGAIAVSPAAPAEGAPATYTASATDPDGGGIVARTTWTWGDGSTPTTANALSAPHTLPESAPYTVGVTVTDAQEQTATFTRTVTPVNLPPVVNAGADRRAQSGEPLALAAPQISDPGVLDTHTCTWSFGDGTPSATGCATAHTYTLPAGVTEKRTYTTTVTVTDDEGASASDSIVVTVYPRIFGQVGSALSGSSGIAWSALHGRFLAVRDAPCGTRLTSVAADGTQGSVLTPQISLACGETPLAVSRGVAGFTNGSAYLGNGRPGEIVRVRFNADGTLAGVDNPWVPASTTGSTGQLTSVVFDESGLLESDLITVWSDGRVLRTASGGSTRQVANLFRPLRGALVLPAGYAGRSGCVLTADAHGNIYSACVGSLPVVVGSAPTSGLPAAIHLVTAPGDLYVTDAPSGRILRADSRAVRASLMQHVLVTTVTGEVYDLRFTTATNTFLTDVLALAIDGGAPVVAEGSAFLPVTHSPNASLAPADLTRAVGTSHTATATMVDAAGNAVAGLPLTFTVLGSHPRTQVVTTNASGVATLTYTGTSIGADFISAVSMYSATANAVVRWRRLSALQAFPALLNETTTQSSIRARLTDGTTGAPLSGKQVVFTTTNVQTGQPQEICRATTGTDGSAACTGVSGQLPATLGGGYTATFPGDSVYLTSTASAPVARVGGNDLP